MEYKMFHFADNAWLWGLLVIPLVATAYALLYRRGASSANLEQFADKHLLPHLLTDADKGARTIWRSVLLWSLIWAWGILAMAGPRWNYTDMQTFKPEQNLVVLLDLSKSMDAQDVKPSRMAVAREKLGDLMKMTQGMNIGLVGYAADAHMISPITDDTKPIVDLLPELDTSLPSVQGNNLKPALSMASRMLDAETGNNKSILVISDGGFRDGNSASMVNDTVSKNISIYTIGVGTEEGAPIPTEGGGWIKGQDGKMVISRLQADKLQALSQQRGGLYIKANYTDDDIQTILNQINSTYKAGQETGQKARVWEEHFYIPVLIMALLILPWFRRGNVFPAIAFLLMFCVSGNNANAASLQDMFLNQAQQAHETFDKGDYKSAAEKFDTPYRRGVAEYKAKDYAEAEKSFAQAEASMPEAQYNLGNAQVMQGKYEDAIASYESVLKRDPHNANASHNLDIARKLLQLQKQQPQNDKKESSQQQKDQKSSQQKSGEGKQQQQQNSASTTQGQQQSKPEDKSGKESAANKEGDQQKQATQQQGEAQEKYSEDKKQDSVKQQGQGNNNQPQPQNAAQAKNIGKNGSDEKISPEAKAAVAEQAHPRTQKDIDADQWLSRIENDPQSFLKNQFQIETLNNGTTQGDEPW